MTVRNKRFLKGGSNAPQADVGAWERRFATFAAPFVMPQALCFALSCSVFAFRHPLSDVSYTRCPELHARVRSVVCNVCDVVSFTVLGHAVYHRFLIPCCSVVRALCCRALCCVFSAPHRFHSQNPWSLFVSLCFDRCIFCEFCTTSSFWEHPSSIGKNLIGERYKPKKKNVLHVSSSIYWCFFLPMKMI